MWKVAFYGGGRVVRILLEGWKLAGRLPERVFVIEPDQDALARLQDVVPGVSPAATGNVGGCELVFLAVHPPVMEEALDSLAGVVGTKSVVVSLAPKIRSDAIAQVLRTERVVRMIPNAPSAIGAGYNPVFFGKAIQPKLKKHLISLFAPWGELPEVSEADLEAYAVVSAMGPTYFWYQIQTLRDLATSFGLTPEAADDAIGKMLGGAVRFLLARGRECMDLIPLRPLQGLESTVTDAYNSRLREVYSKLSS